MENTKRELYDLAMLVEQSDLNMRQVAVVTPNVTAGEYFDMLTELLHSAPQFVEDLSKLMNRDGDRTTYKNLTGMFGLLKSLGYEKHAIDFDGIHDAYDRGHSRLTSVYAKKILDDFDGLCTKVMDSKLSRLPDSQANDPYETSLREWVRLLYKDKDDDGSKPVILAVDDSPVILKSVSSLLSGDYKVYALAKSVLLAKTLSQIKPDLFLLDYLMPIINGFELIPVIRGFPEHKETPIIFLTSEGTIDNVAGAVMLGASDFIAKPVQPNVLRERIARHLVNRGQISDAS